MRMMISKTEIIEKKICKLGSPFSVDKVPQAEQHKEWFQCLIPLIYRFLERENPSRSAFIRTLFDTSYGGWSGLKEKIQWAINHLENWQSCLSLTSRIKSNPSPDEIIRAALAELTAAKYLHLREFSDIKFEKKGIDLQGTYAKELWHCEVTFITGPDFKTQRTIEPSAEEGQSDTVILDSEDLTKTIKSKYSKKKRQLERRLSENDRRMIVIVTHLQETHEPWLSHESNNGNHPILNCINLFEVPTVVIGRGTIYEPSAPFVRGSFPINKLWNRPATPIQGALPLENHRQKVKDTLDSHLVC